MAVSGGVSRWTQYFSVASALSIVLLQILFLFEVSYRVIAIIGLFASVIPMVFGMGYLL